MHAKISKVNWMVIDFTSVSLFSTDEYWNTARLSRAAMKCYIDESKWSRLMNIFRLRNHDVIGQRCWFFAIPVLESNIKYLRNLIKLLFAFLFWKLPLVMSITFINILSYLKKCRKNSFNYFQFNRHLFAKSK